MNRDRNLILQRREFIDKRLNDLRASGLSGNQAVSLISKELFISERTVWGDLNFVSAKKEINSIKTS